MLHCVLVPTKINTSLKVPAFPSMPAFNNPKRTSVRIQLLVVHVGGDRNSDNSKSCSSFHHSDTCSYSEFSETMQLICLPLPINCLTAAQNGRKKPLLFDSEGLKPKFDICDCAADICTCPKVYICPPIDRNVTFQESVEIQGTLPMHIASSCYINSKQVFW